MSWPFRVTDPLLDVLEVLVDADGELHGWAIMKQTQRTGPTVYQVLERLRKAKWVECWWEDKPPATEQPTACLPETDPLPRESVPRRRYYRLSDDGTVKAPILLAERGRCRTGAQSRNAIPRLAFFGKQRRFIFGGGW
jgi:PadR family transcriptional regulator PadR